MTDYYDTPRVTIIGTSGRGKDALLLSPPLYPKMVKAAMRFIASLCPPRKVRLVSSGLPWSGHIPVTLFNTGVGRDLLIYAPVRFDVFRYTFSAKKRSPDEMNDRYDIFSMVMGRDMKQEVTTAISNGARIVNEDLGLYLASRRASESEHVVAFSCGQSHRNPTTRWAKYCWRKAEGMQRHIIRIKDL